jgi:S-adenosylmethionine hydrolase
LHNPHSGEIAVLNNIGKIDLHRPSGIITLTTDFGLADTFVAQMKGVILSINADAKIVDITHQIRPFSITDAARAISVAYPYFPKGTIHIGVTDPGVGSERRGLLICAGGHYFVGPDNGIFSLVVKKAPDFRALSLRPLEDYPLSSTFHGRDLFAPVAAMLSLGKSPESVGSLIEEVVMIDLSEPTMTNGSIVGTITAIDNFGNAITNIPLIKVSERSFKVLFRGREVPCYKFYKQAEGKGLGYIANSQGLLELFVFNGNASEAYGIKVGEVVTVIPL